MKKKKRHYREIFTTRKDFYFLIAIISLSLFFMSYTIFFFEMKKYMEAVISLILVFVFLSFIFNNKIVLESYYIRIYFGIFAYKIKYKDIKGLYIINHHFISLSSSFHKVGIQKRKHKSFFFDTFISPFDCEDFIETVKEKCGI